MSRGRSGLRAVAPALPPPGLTAPGTNLLLPLTTWLTQPGLFQLGRWFSRSDTEEPEEPRRSVGPVSLNHCTGKGSTWTGDVDVDVEADLSHPATWLPRPANNRQGPPPCGGPPDARINLRSWLPPAVALR
ncbi:hypothetical protein ABZP36_027775 [Zizania latifolia]